MKNLKVSVRLIISFAVVIVLSISIAATGLWGITRLHTVAYEIYDYNVMAMDILGLIRENFALQRNTSRELIIYDADSGRYESAEKMLVYLEQKMDEYVHQYIPTINTIEDQDIFQQFHEVYYNEYAAFKKEFIRLAGQNQKDEVLTFLQTRGDKIVSTITKSLNTAHNVNLRVADTSLRENEELTAYIKTAVILVLAASIIIVILLVVYHTNMISVPLRHMSATLNHMATTGDMVLDEIAGTYSKMDSDRGDEIGLASQSINKLLNHIWYVEKALAHISNGNFTIDIKTLSDRDTMGLSLSKVLKNLNDMFTKVKDAEEAALAASKAKSTFLAHMSHEIRTPLNAIMGMAMIINNTPDSGEKALSCANQIMVSSRHLLSVLNDVLDMSKIESGKFELSSEPFSLQSALNEIHGTIAHRCAEKNIVLESNVGEIDDVVLIGDKMRINQVLINLLGNAVKFTDSNGNIKFQVDIVDNTENSVRVKYAVSDTGIGISSDKVSALFKPFEQGDSTVASKYGGTGLGLSISQNLVNMMGGLLEVESDVGAGSTFYFTLSFKKGAKTKTCNHNSLQSLDLSGKRILLAEDVEINRIIICELLSATNVIIDEAENGQQVIDIFDQSPECYYDLIFMDVQMPILDGHEATRKIRGLSRSDAESVPIVAMTAHAYKEDVDRCLAAGMNGHVSKPIEIDAILNVLQEFTS